MNKFGIIILVGAVLAASASAQVTKSGNGYLFRNKFTKGQVIRYALSTNGKANGQAFAASTPISMKTLSVSGGVGTIAYSMGPMKMTLNGKPFNMGPNSNKVNSVTARVDSFGRNVGGQSGVSTMTLPEKPIPVGGTWSGTSSAPAGPAGQMNMNATYKFLGFETIAGMKAAKISVRLSGSGKANVAGNGTTWVAVSDGSLIKLSSNMTTTMGQMSMPMTMSIIRR